MVRARGQPVEEAEQAVHQINKTGSSPNYVTVRARADKKERNTNGAIPGK